jgi:vesicular inhibitory amino acid transporter
MTSPMLTARRSSISVRMQSIAQAGGVNSIENFARSWQRAVGFHEIAPARNSFLYTEEPIATGREYSDASRTPAQHRSLLRQQIEQDGTPPEAAVLEDGLHNGSPEASDANGTGHVITGSPHDDIFSHASHLASGFSSSFGGTYGSISDRVNETSREHAAKLFIEQQRTGEHDPDKEREPMLLKRIEEEDGKVVIEVVGQSTIYQTILNSTNVLIGVGLLSLPLGIRYAGWVIGLIFLSLSALATGYTARLLGKCMTLDRSLITFADLAYVSFGPKAQIAIGIMFSLELTAAAVALFILFADSLNLLVSQWGVLEFKVVCALILFPLSFVPLRYLGYTSSLGIVCCISSTGPNDLFKRYD